MTAPSGQQHEIVHGEQRATVVEVGGGLRTYTAAGHDVLDGYPLDEMCTSGRGQVLAPWPNRIEDGTYEFGGARHGLPLTQPEERNAIHGLVRWASWAAREHEGSSVLVEHALHPQPGYPFSLELAIGYALSDEGLRVTTTATNVGPSACPFGAGAHPYLTVGAPIVDLAALRVPAETVLQSDERGLPTGSGPVEGTDYDFRTPRPIGATRLDHCFTSLVRDADGVARVTLEDPETGRALTVWVDRAYPYLMLFTGDPLPEVSRRSLAIEPMTCPPNAFRTGEAVIRLEPGDSATAVWGISPA